MENSGEKLSYMDGLRGLAAFVVILTHFANFFFPAAVYGSVQTLHSGLDSVIFQTPINLVVSGNFAVCIFFVISGFVLSYKFFVTQRVEVPISGAIRRYFRLMPAVLVSVIVSYLIMTTGHYYGVPVSRLTASPWIITIWNGPARLLDAVRLGLFDAFTTGLHVKTYNDVLWTMAFEFKGSLAVFAILGVFGKWRRRWIVYLLLGLLSCMTYYFAFVLGLALCDLVVHERHRGRRIGHPIVGYTALTAGLILGTIPDPFGNLSIMDALASAILPLSVVIVLLHVIGAALVVSSLVLLPRFRSLLSSRPLANLGRLSFAVYLTHLLVLGSVCSFLFLWCYPRIGYGYSIAVAFVVLMGVTFPVAEVLTRYVDTPAVRLSGKIYRLARGISLPVLGKVSRSTRILLPVGTK